MKISEIWDENIPTIESLECLCNEYKKMYSKFPSYDLALSIGILTSIINDESYKNKINRRGDVENGRQRTRN